MSRVYGGDERGEDPPVCLGSSGVSPLQAEYPDLSGLQGQHHRSGNSHGETGQCFV